MPKEALGMITLAFWPIMSSYTVLIILDLMPSKGTRKETPSFLGPKKDSSWNLRLFSKDIYFSLSAYLISITYIGSKVVYPETD